MSMLTLHRRYNTVRQSGWAAPGSAGHTSSFVPLSDVGRRLQQCRRRFGQHRAI